MKGIFQKGRLLFAELMGVLDAHVVPSPAGWELVMPGERDHSWNFWDDGYLRVAGAGDVALVQESIPAHPTLAAIAVKILLNILAEFEEQIDTKRKQWQKESAWGSDYSGICLFLQINRWLSPDLPNKQWWTQGKREKSKTGREWVVF